MKLCIVTPCAAKGDGQGRVNYEIAWEAIRRGHHVTLLASKVAPELQNHSKEGGSGQNITNLMTQRTTDAIISLYYNQKSYPETR